jgi:hypothetical protein
MYVHMFVHTGRTGGAAAPADGADGALGATDDGREAGTNAGLECSTV